MSHISNYPEFRNEVLAKLSIADLDLELWAKVGDGMKG
jgi:hypothetical protein